MIYTFYKRKKVSTFASIFSRSNQHQDVAICRNEWCLWERILYQMVMIHTKAWHSSFISMRKSCHLFEFEPQIYDYRIDFSANFCWGCKDDHVASRVAGGSVCWSCLNRLTIRLAVCSVARSLPAHKIYRRSNVHQ